MKDWKDIIYEKYKDEPLPSIFKEIKNYKFKKTRTMAQDTKALLRISVEEYSKLLSIFHTMETFLEYEANVLSGNEFYKGMISLTKTRMKDRVDDYRRYTKEQDADTKQI